LYCTISQLQLDGTQMLPSFSNIIFDVPIFNVELELPDREESAKQNLSK